MAPYGKRIAFHVPFRLGYAISGGGIRPGKMIAAFEELGYAVDVVSGDKANRMKGIDEIRQRLERGEEYAFCYAESSVLPTMLTEKGNKPFYPFVDFDFFRMLKKRGIKVGLFYRDIYWKFRYFMQDKPVYERWWRKFFYHLDFHYYTELLDVFFLPSMKLAYLLPENLKSRAFDLPAAHDMKEDVVRPAPKLREDLRFIYVGGVSNPVYNISPLIRMGEEFAVTVCTREGEWAQWKGFYGTLPKNVTVCHLHGDALKAAFKEHNVYAIVRTNHEYLNFAMPNKLYEAVGQNMPLLATGATSVGNFVAANDIGWVLDGDFSDFDPDRMITEFDAKVEHMQRIKAEHHWVMRARKVESLLS
ncbi:hypothetical protein [Pseudodesulfovibrio sediminis]|uniref:Glycosyl transferase n=1 Tax=Pseudodesulfovibrio sediminis TaxID=2810563 RepID=A0ABM7P865_9BACT|nr:hypothetical protein [Pseudodesulfovibrio sediminis]BCS89174.1 glycosyl transferase [Pseudodesulfovibrio sediminis]